MSQSGDPFSGVPQGGWGSDEKGQPMLVVPAAPAEFQPAAVVSRRSAALMWMGALLGGTVIASIFLVVMYVDTAADARSLRRDLATSQESLSKTRSDLSALTEREKSAVQYARALETDNKALRTENAQLRQRLRLPAQPRPAPSQPDPFRD